MHQNLYQVLYDSNELKKYNFPVKMTKQQRVKLHVLHSSPCCFVLSGRRIWRYSGSDLDPGFPMRSSDLGLPNHTDCAFFYQPLGRMVLFRGSRYYVLNPESLSVELYYPRALRDWKGLPRGLNGALTRPDGKLYFFKEQQYWRFDPGKVRITATGQWADRLPWIGCHTNPSLQDNELL